MPKSTEATLNGSPAIADAQLQLAIAYADQRDLESARRHAQLAAAQATPDWPNLESLGVLLFQLSRFSAARRLLTQAEQNRPLGSEALKMLAALYRRSGETAKARHCIAAWVQLDAIAAPNHPHPDRPNILRLRSVEKSYFGIKTNRKTGLRYCWLKGGHFSSKNLIDRSRCNLYVGTVSGHNPIGPEALPGVDLIVNGVSCADLDPIGLNHVEACLANFPDVPVINPPSQVRHTTRAENARRLGVLPHVILPQAELFRLEGAAAAIATQIEATGLSYPMIVRHRGTQTGKTVEKVDHRPALVEWLAAQPPGTEVYATAFIDCRWPDGYYHKTRVFFIDGELFPVASLASDTWQIHSGDRYRIMSSTPSTQADEQRFLNDPAAYLGPKAFDALYAICDTIGLDFFGIDFTLDAEGNVIVFEANAAMRHNFDHAENFPYTRPHLENVSAAFAAMLDRRLTAKMSPIP
ncbi:tetratricopeptide repeat protein [Leptolyngbya iicbica]|uniref:Tetratricopeptide repeat protein n=2 Tax=Cyanophyceae TaxID=3028117 RepID=A0A4Q7EGY8_9CYAN|nr:tetratricopeptide repeat protein [Leptolyngbya sp. LK]RZM82552.1 tetratricopeptide repeat protein [Leptolyngbya sp. LK]